MIGRAAHHAAGHGAEAGFLELRRVPALEFGIDLVPPHRLAGSARDHAHVVEAERQQHGLLQPLVDLPAAVGLALGDARLAGVEQVERGLDRLAHRALGLGADVVARLEGLVDGLGKLVGTWLTRLCSAAVCRGQGGGCQADAAGLSSAFGRNASCTVEFLGLLLRCALLAAAEPAFAHHLMGGKIARHLHRRPPVRPRPSGDRHRSFRRRGRGRLPCRRAPRRRAARHRLRASP